MPDQILGRVLRSLERVYSFRTAQKGAPDSFELDLPIQPVQDLSEMAALGSAVGPADGWWIIATLHTHVAVGSIESTPNFRSPTNSRNQYPPAPAYDPSEQMVWVYNSWMRVSTNGADFAYGTVEAVYQAQTLGPQQGTGAVVTGPVLFYADGPLPSGGVAILPDLTAEQRFPLPGIMSANLAGSLDFELLVRTTADNGGSESIYTNTLFWLGNRGVRPPLP